MKVTQVISKDAKYGRIAYLNLEEHMIIFDCSDGEYGPISFPIAVLKESISKHEK